MKDAIIEMLFSNMAIIDLHRMTIPGIKSADPLSLRVHRAISLYQHAVIDFEAMRDLLKEEINWIELPGHYMAAYYVVEPTEGES